MRTTARLFALCLLVMPTTWSHASDCLEYGWGGTASPGINFVTSVGSEFTSAIGVWDNGCGSAVPPLTRSTSPAQGILNINVRFVQNGYECGSSRTACGCSEGLRDPTTGEIVGGTISAFGTTAEGNPCSNPRSTVYAHEIGHFLGLDDTSDGANCANNVMYQSAAATSPTVSASQCNAIDLEWQEPGEDECDTQPAPRGCDNGIDQPGSPIVVDLKRDGLRFTSPNAGVSFDLNSDGVAEELAWVADPTDAFLARDLNGNGRIDDGSELFGNFTVLQDGSLADHGFEVLAELDQPILGGNGDGALDAEDWAYYDLLLWTDTNLNGRSEPEEIASLASSPVLSISISYRTTRQADRFGNLLTYWSQVQVLKDGKVLPTKAVDVFFQTP